MKSQGKPGLNMRDRPAGPEPSTDALGAAGTLLQGRPTGITETRTGYQTALAVQVPRDVDKVKQRVLKEAALAGEDFIYTWRQKDKQSKEPDGKTTIEGVSIDGAMILLRNWGNAAIPTRMADETPTHFLLEATFIDLETGFSMPRLFRQRKGESHGSYDNERQQDIAFQIGQSKCQRNAIVKGLPTWLQKAAVDAAKSEAVKQYAKPEEHVPKVRAYATKLGITDAQLLWKVGKPFDQWTPYDLVFIRAIFRSIADRESSVGEEFGGAPEKEAAPTEAKTITTDGEVVEEPAATPGSPPPVTPAATPAEGVPAAKAPEPVTPPSKPAVEEPPATKAEGTTVAKVPLTSASSCPQCGNLGLVVHPEGVRCGICGYVGEKVSK